ncbi:mas-related G-protein coupled receptor member X2-like [Antechinus flavipes]|uniref:mas-related G-protein coupled receptor member X2-like n=1 Tax=Antechinus flavipes TaxID=38775 RepID=UPI002236248A|nr:mas-related G-protein coupled receptor member X2-like [Antechinus flavipes]
MAQFSTESPQDQGFDHGIEATGTDFPHSPVNVTEERTHPSVVPYFVLVISLGGLVSNGLVIWILSFCIKKNPFSVYILNLAWADFLHLVCWTLITINFFFPSPLISIHVVIAPVTVIFYSVGLSLLVAISTERCLSVLFPIWYQCLRPRRTSALVCTLVWLLFALLLVAMGLMCVYLAHSFCYGFFVTSSLWILLLIALMSVSSLALLLSVQCSSQRRQPPRLYVLILLTVLLFFLCGLPFGILLLMQSLELSFPFMMYLYKVSPLLSTLNSSINPLIYFFLGSSRQKRLRESLTLVLQRVLGEEAELEDGTKTASIGPMEITL